MSVWSGIVAIDDHKPFTSVGLTCTCGRSVVGFEGLLSCECGAVYTVAVMVIRQARNGHSGTDTA